ncbi:hypothetical protein K466DRAFT_647822 [Polyporus arcularius HHB13444]|uniref:Uncharacterized protein n=1 Tax=Polyporus arcularius HHB13444 TaxID=1314778 RepID=A0A5C3PAT6_9APHY|nr:hypothetical protein K466DRAFT_647822 [Polyporus arcularius HHB13444]
MPHKRAKRSVREQKRKESGSDIAPGLKKAIENEDIPKSVSRVLNAAKVRQEWAEKKRKGFEDDGAGPSRKRRKQSGTGDGDTAGAKQTQLRIMPGESMAHFNRRVEESMRHTVKEAMQSSSARMRQVRKEELAASEKEKKKRAAEAEERTKGRKRIRAGDELDSDDDPSPRKAKAKEAGPKDFEKISTSAPKRLNDIVQAPPNIKQLPRKAKKLAAQGGSQKDAGGQSLSDGVRSMAQKAMLEEERERAIRLYREMKKGRAAG